MKNGESARQRPVVSDVVPIPTLSKYCPNLENMVTIRLIPLGKGYNNRKSQDLRNGLLSYQCSSFISVFIVHLEHLEADIAKDSSVDLLAYSFNAK